MKNLATIVPPTSAKGGYTQCMGTKVVLPDGSELGGVTGIVLTGYPDDLWRARIECVVNMQPMMGMLSDIVPTQAKRLTWWRRLLLLAAGCTVAQVRTLDEKMQRRELAMASIDQRAADAQLLEQERAKYEAVWVQPEYRVANQAMELLAEHPELIPSGVRSALDIGCGNGRLFAMWNTIGIDGHGVDFAAAALDEDHPNRDSFSLQCLWDMRFDRTFDLGVCADVMEHIPPSKVDDVLARIAEACDYVVFQIANYPSSYGDGMLHLTLQPADWWLAKLQQHGDAAYLPDLHRLGVEEYVFTLRTKRSA